MTENELNILETQIDKLIATHQQAKLENIALQKKITTLNNENIALLDKKKKTAGSIKKLILQLQDELLCQTQK